MIPRHYAVDGQGEVQNPVGMHGFKLDVETHVITAAVTSVRLKDVIATGSGNIDLFKASVQSRNPTAAQLEEFRSRNGGDLVFAIDVNEAASGTEKSASQGVSIDTAWVDVTVNRTTTRYPARGCADGESAPSTKTKSALARTGQTTRSLYCTLIGDAGSRTVTSSTSSDINLSSFDATLGIPVGVNLSSASAAPCRCTRRET